MSKTYLFLCSRQIDQYYVICIICYGVTIFWTLGFYNAYPFWSVILTGLICPAIGFCFFNLIQIYISNSFFFVVDTDGINRNIIAHNKRVDEIKVKGRDIRNKIIEHGPEAVYGEENGKLVKKVMDIEIARRQAAKLNAKIAGDEDSEDMEGSSIKRSKTGMMGRGLAPPESPVKSPTKFAGDNDPGMNSMMGSPGGKGQAFGGTMSGFKLDGESSEEDIDAIPPYLRAYYP